MPSEAPSPTRAALSPASFLRGDGTPITRLALVVNVQGVYHALEVERLEGKLSERDIQRAVHTLRDSVLLQGVDSVQMHAFDGLGFHQVYWTPRSHRFEKLVPCQPTSSDFVTDGIFTGLFQRWHKADWTSWKAGQNWDTGHTPQWGTHDPEDDTEDTRVEDLK